MTSIKDYAFRNCTNLANIDITDSVTSIGEKAFLGCTNLVIYGNDGSYVQQYAEEHDILFALINEKPTYKKIDSDNDGFLDCVEITGCNKSTKK